MQSGEIPQLGYLFAVGSDSKRLDERILVVELMGYWHVIPLKQHATLAFSFGVEERSGKTRSDQPANHDLLEGTSKILIVEIVFLCSSYCLLQKSFAKDCQLFFLKCSLWRWFRVNWVKLVYG